MPWLRIDENFAQHPKIIGLSDRAFRLHFEALCYCAQNLTDGFVADGVCLAIRRRLAGDSRVRMTSVNELVDGGLWAKTDHGYVIHDYLEYNPDASSVKASRKANADRQARYRNRRNGVTETVTPEVSQRYVTGPRPDPYKERSKERKTVTRSTGDARLDSELGWAESDPAEPEGTASTHPLVERLRQSLGEIPE